MGTQGTSPMDRHAQRVGSVLKGKWRLDALIGVGGMASVYSATHRNGSRVAIKILNPEYAAHAESVARFMREGYVANKISHPGSVLVLDDDVDEHGSAFLVMELLSGFSLERYARRGGARLPLDQILHVAEQILDLLVVAHGHGILHRDIKPANIQVTAEGVVKLLDFGIARLAEQVGDVAATQTGAALGTPSYMPPEQARGRWNMVDPRTDLWALGATMHALILGERPRRAETVQEEMLLAMTAAFPSLAQTAPGAPPPVVAFVDTATAFDMNARFPNATAMLGALRQLKVEVSAPLSALLAPPQLAVGSTPPGPATGGSSSPRLDTARMVPPSKPLERDPSTFQATEHTSQPVAAKSKPLWPIAAGVVVVLLAGGGLGARALMHRGAASAAAAPPPTSTTVEQAPAPAAAVPKVAVAPSTQPAVELPDEPGAPPPATSRAPLAPAASTLPLPTPAASTGVKPREPSEHHHTKPAGGAAPADSASIYDERF